MQSDRFTVVLHDAPNMPAAHTTETVSYIVLEEGLWELPNGDTLEVGTVSTAATRSESPATWESVSFDASFTATPVILSQVQTYNDPHWVKTRQHSASSTGFSVALEEDEVQSLPHGVERIGWFAIETNTNKETWSGHKYEASETPNSVTGSWYTQNFAANHFTSAPGILASVRTVDGADPCYPRYQSLNTASVQFKTEEDTTADSETGHTSEIISYLAIQGEGLLTGMMAEPVVTKYYYFGGQRVAMRQCVDSTCDDPVYLHGDHLGSASLTTDSDGEVISHMRYYPYGATRSGTVGTDYRFTGQRSETVAGGIYDYRARYYDPRLQWIQPDTIVPDFSNPQSLNRYAYVLNNPLGYNDPTGHDVGCPGNSLENCETYEFTDEQWNSIYEWAAYFEIPPEFLAAEILHDTDWHDGPTDIVIGSVAIIGTSDYPHQQNEKIMAEAMLQAVEGDFLIPLVGLSYGSGTGQIHAPTARAAEGHFGDTFPNPAGSSSDLYAQLTSNSGNIKYTAAILRMYADQRPVSRNDQGEMTVDEAGAVFANYHETVETAFESPDLYKAGAPPNSNGQFWVDQLRPKMRHYRYLLRK